MRFSIPVLFRSSLVISMIGVVSACSNAPLSGGEGSADDDLQPNYLEGTTIYDRVDYGEHFGEGFSAGDGDIQVNSDDRSDGELIPVDLGKYRPGDSEGAGGGTDHSVGGAPGAGGNHSIIDRPEGSGRCESNTPAALLKRSRFVRRRTIVRKELMSVPWPMACAEKTRPIAERK